MTSFPQDAPELTLFVEEYIKVGFPQNLRRMSTMIPISKIEVKENGSFSKVVFACGDIVITSGSQEWQEVGVADGVHVFELPYGEIDKRDQTSDLLTLKSRFVDVTADTPCDLGR